MSVIANEVLNDAEPVEIVTEAAPPADERDYEGEARHQGWVPEPEWHGDPNKWRPAKEFIEVGEHIAAVANSRKRDLEREVDRLRETNNLLLAKYQVDLRREQVDKERLRGDLETKLARALSNADGSAAVQINKQLAALDQPQSAAAAPVPLSPAELQWRSANPWYGLNPELTETANRIGGVFMAANPGATPEQIFNHVSQSMNNSYNGFQPQRRPASPDSPAPGAPQRRAKGPGYNDLDDVARATCDELIAQGHKVKVDERGQLIQPSKSAAAKGKWIPMTRDHYIQIYQNSK